jgi:hypothetical protein
MAAADINDGCGRQKLVAAPRCLRVNNENFCRQGVSRPRKRRREHMH